MKIAVALYLSVFALINYIQFYSALDYARYFKKGAPSSVMLLSPDGQGGGTGFQVQAQNGKHYIVTNDHVCNLTHKGYLMAVPSLRGGMVPLIILRQSTHSDLCLLEPIIGYPSLKLAKNNAKYGDKLYVVGHPRLRPVELKRGYTRKYETIIVPVKIVEDTNECSEPKNRIMGFRVRDQKIEYLCGEAVRSQQMTVPIEPGNSGSGVMDKDGKVVGVAFAGGGGHTYMVPLSDLKKFLRDETY